MRSLQAVQKWQDPVWCHDVLSPRLYEPQVLIVERKALNQGQLINRPLDQVFSPWPIVSRLRSRTCNGEGLTS